MARNGDTEIEFNQQFFETAMRNPAVENLSDNIGSQALTNAKANAPVASGDYRDGLRITHRESRHRRVTIVEGTDPKTLLIESKTGNLARSLKGTRK